MSLKQSSNAAWIGLDLGTQSVRAMVVSGTGETLAVGSHKLVSRRDGPRHEQDPEEWWRAISDACRAALATLPAILTIQGVAVDGTSGSILLVDGGGRPLTPGLMYDDTRAVEETKRANEAGASVWAMLGYNRMQASWGLPKLLWLLAHHRGLAAGTRLAHQADFINRRLIGGEVATGTSNALKTGVDLINERWPREVFAALGVPGEILPGVVRAGTSLCGERGGSYADGHPARHGGHCRDDGRLCGTDGCGGIERGKLELRTRHLSPLTSHLSLRGMLFWGDPTLRSQSNI